MLVSDPHTEEMIGIVKDADGDDSVFADFLTDRDDDNDDDSKFARESIS